MLCGSGDHVPVICWGFGGILRQRSQHQRSTQRVSYECPLQWQNWVSVPQKWSCILCYILSVHQQIILRGKETRQSKFNRDYSKRDCVGCTTWLKLWIVGVWLLSKNPVTRMETELPATCPTKNRRKCVYCCASTNSAGVKKQAASQNSHCSIINVCWY